MIDALKKKKEMRFLFLKFVYEETDGHPMKAVDLNDVGSSLGVSWEDADGISRYLEGEGLTETITMDGALTITHQGAKEIEDAISNPSKETQYFPAINVINIHSMSNSQIQQGTVNSTQTLSASSKEILDALGPFLAAVKSSQASEDAKELAQTHASILAQQAKLPNEHRDVGVVRSTLDKLSKFNTLVTFGKTASIAYPILEQAVRSFFGI